MYAVTSAFLAWKSTLYPPGSNPLSWIESCAENTYSFKLSNPRFNACTAKKLFESSRILLDSSNTTCFVACEMNGSVNSIPKLPINSEESITPNRHMYEYLKKQSNEKEFNLLFLTSRVESFLKPAPTSRVKVLHTLIIDARFPLGLVVVL